jgi:CRP-like cAMP-binding protein
MTALQHPFKKFIEEYVLLTDTEWIEIQKCIEPKWVRKGELILKEGTICKHLYFLEKGLLRFFTWKDGNDITKYFTEECYLFTSQKSFTKQQPSSENIETLEDSLIWQMTYDHAHALLSLPGWNTFIRKLIQEVQSYTEEILEDLQTRTAEDRYKIMLDNSSSLIQRVSLRHLASYLGIAPQSLSRIRKNMLHKNRS